MNIQQLIDVLQKIEDKTIQIGYDNFSEERVTFDLVTSVDLTEDAVILRSESKATRDYYHPTISEDEFIKQMKDYYNESFLYKGSTEEYINKLIRKDLEYFRERLEKVKNIKSLFFEDVL